MTIAQPDESLRPRGDSRRAAAALLQAFGWRLVWVPPPGPKSTLMVYPHTSNWDFVIGVLYRHAVGLEARWMGKDSLFKGPAGPLMRTLGGIPIDRRAARGVIAATVAQFRRRDRLCLAITPEGTRSYVPRLKSGFYRISLAADLPCGLGFIDYGSRSIGVDTWVRFSGDEARDLAMLREFYADKRGRRHECTGTIAFAPAEPEPESES